MPPRIQPPENSTETQPALLELHRVIDKRASDRVLHLVFSAVSRLPGRMRARVQRGTIRAFYSAFSWILPTDRLDVTFLNYGYAPLDTNEAGVSLHPDDAHHEAGIRLYERVTSSVDLAGRDVLEVGSGRGGGTSYVARYRQPRTMTGLDLAPRAVAFCQRRHRADNLKFLEGDAEQLPFPDESFDAVINVESSHCYPSFDRFLSEVSRVLRPGGAFLFTDMRPPHQVAEMRDKLRSVFTVAEEECITPGVSNSLKIHSERHNAMISAHVPKILQPMIRGFAAVEGSDLFEALKNSELEYVRFVLRKRSSLGT